MLNTGSSSTKVRLVEDDDAVSWQADLPALDPADADGSLGVALGRAPAGIDAVGHRVVHGGTAFSGPVVVDRAVESELRRLCDLAPLHQTRALAAMDAARRVLPGVPVVASFDTAFHATMAPSATTYALPAAWRRGLGVRRYGFHGLSHAYAARRAAQLLGIEACRRLVTCHLGAGASLAAVAEGRSVDTTMGFTPLEGIVMATRSGSLDPGIVTWLVTHAGLEVQAVADALEHSSGVLALAGTTDMGALARRAEEGDEDAGLALAVYLRSLRAAVAAMASALGGLDTLVFTGGVGENVPSVRAGVAEGLGFMGVAVDRKANAAAVPDTEISAAGALVHTLVLAAREDLQVAAEVRSLLGAGPPRHP